MQRGKVSSTRFKIGHKTWNKSVWIPINCKTCNKEFNVTPSRKNTAKCCSKNCANKWQSDRHENKSKISICYNLAKDGKTIREISEITRFPAGTISSYLNKALFRKYSSWGRFKILNLAEYKKCCICGFDRIVELAHIIPASKGGPLSIENTLPLCPNHHHLFDNRKLTESELLIVTKKIQEKSNADKIPATK